MWVARPQAADHADKRRAILEASAALFAEHGVRGTSMSMIASAASGSKAWLYHYYPSKEAIVEDLLTSFLQSVVTAASEALDTAGPPAARLRRLMVDVVRTCNAAPGGPALLELSDGLSESALSEVVALRRRFVEVVEAAIVAVDPSLRSRPGRRAPVVQSTLGMLHWQHRWWDLHGPLSLEQWGHVVADMVIGGIGAVAKDRRLP
jgi:TetR/AcrR family transcriptional regulator